MKSSKYSVQTHEEPRKTFGCRFFWNWTTLLAFFCIQAVRGHACTSLRGQPLLVKAYLQYLIIRLHSLFKTAPINSAIFWVHGTWSSSYEPWNLQPPNWWLRPLYSQLRRNFALIWISVVDDVIRFYNVVHLTWKFRHLMAFCGSTEC